jgi:hypothetical protein
MIPKDNVFSGQNFTLDGVPPHLTLAQIENEMRKTPCKTSRAGSGRSYSASGEFRCVVSGSNRGRLQQRSDFLLGIQSVQTFTKICAPFFDFFTPY